MVKLRTGVVDLPNGQRLHIPLDLGFDWSGKASISANLSPFDLDTVQRFPIGTVMETPNNRFRYAEYGGDTAAGDLVQAEAPDAAHDNLTPAAAAVGDTEITISDTITLVLNEYVGGILTWEAAGAPAGYGYPILKHTAPSSGAVFTIQYGVKIALTATAEVKIQKSLWKEVIESPTTLTAAISGVACGVGADGTFGWVCTRGHWPVSTEGTVVIGQDVRPSETTAGAITAQDYDEADDANIGTIGRVIDVGATTEMSLVNLLIE